MNLSLRGIYLIYSHYINYRVSGMKMYEPELGIPALQVHLLLEGRHFLSNLKPCFREVKGSRKKSSSTKGQARPHPPPSLMTIETFSKSSKSVKRSSFLHNAPLPLIGLAISGITFLAASLILTQN